MPFLRYSRDKRGYEHVYLVEPTAGRRGKVRSRILYWYRTPPNVRVGREPFDADVRRAIETRYPDLEFDWPKLLATPKPAPVNPEAERWRERRRETKRDRAAAAAAAEPEDVTETEPPIEIEPSEPGPSVDAADVGPAVEALEAPSADAQDGQHNDRHKRRRRRRRGRRPGGGTEARGSAGETADQSAGADNPTGTEHHEPGRDEPGRDESE